MQCTSAFAVIYVLISLQMGLAGFEGGLKALQIVVSDDSGELLSLLGFCFYDEAEQIGISKKKSRSPPWTD